MTDTQASATLSEPTQIPTEPKPGWTTSEFISTVLVHALSVLAILLDLLHVDWHRGLSMAEATVPVLAVAVSAILQGAYSDYRTKLKVQHLQENARVRIVQIEKEISKVEGVASIVHSPAVAAALGGELVDGELANAFAVGPITPPQVVVNIPSCPRCGATEVTDNRQ